VTAGNANVIFFLAPSMKKTVSNSHLEEHKNLSKFDANLKKKLLDFMLHLNYVSDEKI
jgi:hypothetical protein